MKAHKNLALWHASLRTWWSDYMDFFFPLHSFNWKQNCVHVGWFVFGKGEYFVLFCLCLFCWRQFRGFLVAARRSQPNIFFPQLSYFAVFGVAHPGDCVISDCAVRLPCTRGINRHDETALHYVTLNCLHGYHSTWIHAVCIFNQIYCYYLFCLAFLRYISGPNFETFSDIHPYCWCTQCMTRHVHTSGTNHRPLLFLNTTRMSIIR